MNTTTETHSEPLRVPLSDQLGAISRAEWERRYAARIRQRAGWTEEEAAEAARVGADEYERNERAAHNVVTWQDKTVAGANSPEDEADEEMSYWEDDGEG